VWISATLSSSQSSLFATKTQTKKDFPAFANRQLMLRQRMSGSMLRVLRDEFLPWPFSGRSRWFTQPHLPLSPLPPQFFDGPHFPQEWPRPLFLMKRTRHRRCGRSIMWVARRRVVECVFGAAHLSQLEMREGVEYKSYSIYDRSSITSVNAFCPKRDYATGHRHDMR